MSSETLLAAVTVKQLFKEPEFFYKVEVELGEFRKQILVDGFNKT